MDQLRIAALLGPAVVLYLLADAGRLGGRIDLWQGTAAIVALVLSLGPRMVRERYAAGEPGALRTGWLGTAAAIVLASRIAAGPETTLRTTVAALAAPLAAALLLDLACRIPDAPRGFDRVASLLLVGSAVVVVLSLLAVLPSFPLPWGGTFRPIPRLAVTPWGALLAGVAIATLLRLLRERLGSSPATIAANAWGLLGLAPALTLGVVLATAYGFGRVPDRFRWDLLAGMLGAAIALYGHVAMIEPGRRIEAAAAWRRALEWALAGLVAMGLAFVLALRLPNDPVSASIVAVLLLVVATLVRRAARPVVRRLFAPYGGRLLDALEQAEVAARRATTFEVFAESLLGPLRVASGDASAEPRLHLTDPELAVRLDAAGVAHLKQEAIAPALLAHLMENPSSTLTFVELDTQVVRRPELRPLHDALASLDAFAVVPIVTEGSLDGMIVVARGHRTAPPSLEETVGLERLAISVAPEVALFAAHVRAEARVGRLGFERDRADERAEQLDDEVRRLRVEVRVLRQGRGAVGLGTTVVAYSAAGRELERALAEVAPTPSPVTLVAEPGMHVDRIAQRIHAASGVADGPLVLADCAALTDEEAERAFFGVEGDAGAPGYLRLADGGTLLLADVVALPMAVQRAVAEAIAARGARPVGSHAIYGFEARLLTASRRPLETLVEVGALDADLGRRLSQAELRVPPLRERREDIPSLALLAVDRASRRLGRPPLGLDAGALEQLVGHDWPGNVRELELVLELAVERTEGEMVLGSTILGVLRALPDAAPDDAFEGSLLDIERRALVRALERAAGNKSEAARALGLKRTTFLDKLRRFGLDDGSSLPPGGAP